MVNALKSLIYEDGVEKLEKSERAVTSMDTRGSSDYLYVNRIEKPDVGSHQLGNDKISSAIKARYTNIRIQLAMVRVVPQSERIHIGSDLFLDRKRMDNLAEDRKSSYT